MKNPMQTLPKTDGSGHRTQELSFKDTSQQQQKEKNTYSE